MKSTSDILKILATVTKKALWALGRHAFLFILFFVCVEIIWGSFIFYKYAYLAERETPQVTGQILKFDFKKYQKVLNELQIRESDTQDSSIID